MADDLRGITEKTMSNKTIAIMVRFKYNSTTYPIKNFTKLYGCKTRTQARKKLNEININFTRYRTFFKYPYYFK